MTKSRHVRVYKRPTREQMWQDYVVDGLSIEQLQVKYGYAHWRNVYQFLVKYEVPLRGHGHFDLRAIPLTNQQREFIAGTLMGDGSIPEGNTRGYIHHALRMSHATKQREYLEWKRTIMVPFVVRTEPYAHKPVGFGRLPVLAYSTVAHPEITQFRRIFYPDGTKRVTHAVLELLTPFSLAVWLMDDGSYQPALRYIILSTSCFTLAEHELMRDFLADKFNLPSRIHATHYGRHWRLYFSPSVARRWRELVGHFVIPSMSYKLPPE